MISEERPSILVVEDNVIVQDSLKKLFSSENYDIHTANNGEEGLNAINEKIYDLIFCDLLMPKVDGMEFCKKAYDAKSGFHGAVIVLTSLDDEEEFGKLRELGVDEIILKPYVPDELLSIAKRK